MGGMELVETKKTEDGNRLVGWWGTTAGAGRTVKLKISEEEQESLIGHAGWIDCCGRLIDHIVSENGANQALVLFVFLA